MSTVVRISGLQNAACVSSSVLIYLLMNSLSVELENFQPVICPAFSKKDSLMITEMSSNHGNFLSV